MISSNKALKFPKKVRLANQKPSIRQLDDLCREVVRLRDKVCQAVGQGGVNCSSKLEVAHNISRSNKHVRFDLDNVRLLCFNHHYNWAHKRPGEFGVWWAKTMKEKDLDALNLRSHDTSPIDWNGIKLLLEQELRRLKKYRAGVI